MQFIDLKMQYESLKSEIDSAIFRVLRHGQFIMGPEIAQLESQLAEYVGVKHCITVASGTMSLEIAMRALGIGPGDEVITSPFTWISCAETISLVGATPVFVDIDLETYNLAPHLLESRISSKTKAIMPVSLFGQISDLSRICQIAEEHGITVIEDAAQSFGAKQNGSRSCSLTRIASTSFFPAKPFGCFGDGGALFTNDDQLAQDMRAIRTHGGVARHHHTLVGTNGRFDTLQAAILLAKFPKFEWEVEKRATIGQMYTDHLKNDCVTPTIMPGNSHVYAQYTIRVDAREALGKSLKEAGIPTAVYYPKCLHEQPVYSALGYTYGDFPASERASREVISLPMHPYMQVADVNKVVSEVRKSLAAK